MERERKGNCMRSEGWEIIGAHLLLSLSQLGEGLFGRKSSFFLKLN
jgi:hypothetical protein